MSVAGFKACSSYSLTIPAPRPRRRWSVVQASGGYGRGTTESSTRSTIPSSWFLCFEWAIDERSTTGEAAPVCQHTGAVLGLQSPVVGSRQSASALRHRAALQASPTSTSGRRRSGVTRVISSGSWLELCLAFESSV